MTTSTTTRFRIDAVPPAALDEVRGTQRDASGHPPARVIAAGGEPLRCCPRDAAPGERLILFGFEPPLPASPHREIGAIFAHAQPCAGPAAADTYPANWRGWQGPRPAGQLLTDERVGAHVLAAVIVIPTLTRRLGP